MFELLMTQEQNKTVGQLFELNKTKSVGQLFELSNTKSVGQFFGLPKNLDQNLWALDRTSQGHNPNAFGSCLNFQRLEDQIHWEVVWSVQDLQSKQWGCFLKSSRPRVLGTCLNFQDSRPKTVVQLFELLKSKSAGQFFDLQRPKSMASSLNFPRLET